MMIKPNVIVRILFFTVLILSFCLCLYTFKYYHVTKFDDLYMCYGRDFFHPEHGRYISTFLCSLFGEYIPYLLNLHPNDSITYYTNPFMGMLIVLFCLVFAKALFIAPKADNHALKFGFADCSYLIAYIFVFLVLFNDNSIFDVGSKFLLSYDYFCFFDYFFPLFFPVLLFNSLVYHIKTKVFPSGTSFIFIMIMLFLTGITNESINLPIFISFCCIILYFLFNIKKIDKKTRIKFISLFLVYILSLICYYISPTDDPLVLKHDTYIDYLKNEFPLFLEQYFGHFCKNILIYVGFVIVPLLLLFNKTRDKYFTSFVIINIFSVFAFYFCSFFRGYILDGIFVFDSYKCQFTYKIMLFYLFLICTGYFADSISKNEKISDIIKSGICIIILVIFANRIIMTLPESIKNIRIEAKNGRTQGYILEKIAINQPEGEDIILPLSYKKRYFFDNQKKWAFAWLIYLKVLHYPELNHKKRVIFDENFEINYDNFRAYELESLPFRNLLQHPINKNEIVGNDGQKVYFIE